MVKRLNHHFKDILRHQHYMKQSHIHLVIKSPQMPCQPTRQGWQSWSEGLKFQERKTREDTDAGHNVDGRNLCQHGRGIPMTHCKQRHYNGINHLPKKWFK